MRPIYAFAVVLSVAGGVSADPIVPTNGESFLLAYGTGVSPQYQFLSTYGSPPPGAVTPPTGLFTFPNGSSAVGVGTAANGASAAFSHTTSNTLVSITGSTSARSTSAANHFVGQSSADSTGVIDPFLSLGYYIEFTLTEASRVRFTVDGTTSPTGSGEYADFGGRLLDGNGNQLYAFGQVALNGVVTGGPGMLELILGPGNYALFVQSQSEVIGAGQSSATVTASVQFLNVIPEPLSVVAFGGLLAAGGAVLLRRRNPRS